MSPTRYGGLPKPRRTQALAMIGERLPAEVLAECGYDDRAAPLSSRQIHHE